MVLTCSIRKAEKWISSLLLAAIYFHHFLSCHWSLPLPQAISCLLPWKWILCMLPLPQKEDEWRHSHDLSMKTCLIVFRTYFSHTCIAGNKGSCNKVLKGNRYRGENSLSYLSCRYHGGWLRMRRKNIIWQGFQMIVSYVQMVRGEFVSPT